MTDKDYYNKAKALSGFEDIGDDLITPAGKSDFRQIALQIEIRDLLKEIKEVSVNTAVIASKIEMAMP